ncbi:MAG TPA: hypothetical protein VHV78_13950, partial [Gemmatimonadaceae bacterium]|nr:hypothetical protein [Gemmatimonadaceae bacterium]
MAYSVQDASAHILARGAPLGVEHVPLRAALGRVLAEDILSPVEQPPWNNSSMDGYAVRAADVVSATVDSPVRLRVAGTIRAGQPAAQSLPPASAIRIMTGAPIPEGANSVIRVEDTDAGETIVAIRDARDVERNIRPRGEDLRVGDIAVARSTTIGAAQLGVLASVGCASVPVHRRPRVAVLTSGDEL